MQYRPPPKWTQQTLPKQAKPTTLAVTSNQAPVPQQQQPELEEQQQQQQEGACGHVLAAAEPVHPHDQGDGYDFDWDVEPAAFVGDSTAASVIEEPAEAQRHSEVAAVSMLAPAGCGEPAAANHANAARRVRTRSKGAADTSAECQTEQPAVGATPPPDRVARLRQLCMASGVALDYPHLDAQVGNSVCSSRRTFCCLSCFG